MIVSSPGTGLEHRQQADEQDVVRHDDGVTQTGQVKHLMVTSGNWPGNR